MKKSVIRRGVEKRSSVVSKFGLTEKTKVQAYFVIDGVPCKMTSAGWKPLTKVS